MGERAKFFNHSPLQETPSWNTYLATKMVTEVPEEDLMPSGFILNIIEYDSLAGNINFVRGSKDSEGTKRIMKALEKISKKDFEIISKT